MVCATATKQKFSSYQSLPLHSYVFVVAIWPVMKKTTVIAKRGILLAGTFGLAAWLCGLIFINKKLRDESSNIMNKALEDLKKKNIKLWIFPEGTRRNTGIIHDFKKGAFYVAIQGQVPILPIVFSSYISFLDDDKKHLNPGEIIISVLPEISTKGLTYKDVNQLMQQTRERMIEKYIEVNREMEKA